MIVKRSTIRRWIASKKSLRTAQISNMMMENRVRPPLTMHQYHLLKMHRKAMASVMKVTFSGPKKSLSRSKMRKRGQKMRKRIKSK